MKPEVYVKCCWCNGSGRIAHPRRTQMYRLICSRPWSSTPGLAKAMGIGLCNAANVAAALHRDGYVTRRGSGSRFSPYEWSRK
jgi:hypothetical protein